MRNILIIFLTLLLLSNFVYADENATDLGNLDKLFLSETIDQTKFNIAYYINDFRITASSIIKCLVDGDEWFNCLSDTEQVRTPGDDVFEDLKLIIDEELNPGGDCSNGFDEDGNEIGRASCRERV